MNKYPTLQEFEEIDQREAVRRIARLRGLQNPESVTLLEVLGLTLFVLFITVGIPSIAGALGLGK